MFLIFGILLVVSPGCGFDEPDFPSESEKKYIPVVISREQLESSFTVAEPKALINPGKIYHYGQYIFVTEMYSGIHIIDNADPSNPMPIKFLSILGCVDLAVKSDVLYADNAVDLLSISIADMNDIKLLNRVRDAFPEVLPPDHTSVPTEFSKANRPANSIIISWN